MSHLVIVQLPALHFKINRVCFTVKENRSHLVNIQDEYVLKQQRKPHAQNDKIRTRAQIFFFFAVAAEFSIEPRHCIRDVCGNVMTASSVPLRGSATEAVCANTNSSQF